MQNEKKWKYLDALVKAVKIKLKGDDSLKITTNDIRDLEDETGLAKATLERIFSLKNEKKRTYRNRFTRDKLAEFIGYKDDNEFVKKYIEEQSAIFKGNADTPKESEENPSILDENKYKASHQYAKKLIEALKSFSFRLKEILEGRALFLLKNAPKDDFTEHRYISTLYRFAAVIAWIRAIRKELVYLDLGNPTQNKVIETALYRIQNTLADGKYLEQLIVKDLCELWEVDFQQFEGREKEQLGIEVENLVKQHLYKGQVLQATDLEFSAQNALLEEITALFFVSPKSIIVHQEKITAHHETAIKMLARKQAWLYFDWQIGLGDFMVEEVERASNRFEVMGYGTFEDFYWEGSKSAQRWIQRVEKLFKNLNIKEKECFDARIRHLKNVYQSMVHLLEVLMNLVEGQDNISWEALRLLKDFGEGL